MSLNQRTPYSSSLRRMLSQKFYLKINPEDIITKPKQSVNEHKFPTFINQNVKSNQQLLLMRKQIYESRQKRTELDKQVDEIMKKMVDEGLVGIAKNKISKNKSHQNLRIISQPSQASAKDLPIKLPAIHRSKALSIRKSTHQRLKTEMKIKQQQQYPDIVDADKYVKHYRMGMSSLKRLNIKFTQ